MVSQWERNLAVLWRDVLDLVNKQQEQPLGKSAKDYGCLQKILLHRGLVQQRFVVEFDGDPLLLTGRENEVLRLICEGLTAPEVAKELDLSKRTIEYFIINLRAKFKVSSKKALVALVLKREILKKMSLV